MKVIRDTLAKLPKQKTNGHNGPGPGMPDIDKLATIVKAAIEAEKDEPNPFPLDSFPKPLAAIVNHWHTVYRRPIDFHGGSILAAASAAIANNVHVEHVSGSVQPVVIDPSGTAYELPITEPGREGQFDWPIRPLPDGRVKLFVLTTDGESQAWALDPVASSSSPLRTS